MSFFISHCPSGLVWMTRGVLVALVYLETVMSFYDLMDDLRPIEDTEVVETSELIEAARYIEGFDDELVAE